MYNDKLIIIFINTIKIIMNTEKEIKIDTNIKKITKVIDKLHKKNDNKNTIIKKKNKKLVRKEDFKIPLYNQYKYIREKNFTLHQLKEICRFYKLKVSGNKKTLIERCYYYLKKSKFAINIQRIMRGFLVRKYIQLRGSGMIHRDKCVNDTDFFTLDNLKEIPHFQFFSFEENGYIYGFDICSFYNLCIKSNNLPKNPYTREPIKNTYILQLRNALRISNILNFKPVLEIDNEYNELNDQEKIKLKILSLFQQIDDLGNYTDPQWLLELNRNQLLKFIRELYDIWDYRLNLSHELRRNICYPHGSPFIHINLNNTFVQNYNEILNDVVNIIDTMINTGIDNNNKCLGAFYCLGALSLVNRKTAEALPWLYESFYY